MNEFPKPDALEDFSDSQEEILPEIEKQVGGALPAPFRDLPETVRREVFGKISNVAISVSHSTWQGNYPPPQILKGYEAVSEGLGSRVVKMAEDDLAHTHRMDEHLANYFSNGQRYGFALAAIAILGSVYLISIGERVSGGILGSTVLIPLVTLFVRGQIQLGRGSASNDQAPNSDAQSQKVQQKGVQKKGRQTRKR